jgi:hypothetical protein
MLAPTLQEHNEKTETMEFIEMLKTMTEKEKQQVKGILIGIQLSKQSLPQKTA